MSKEELNDKITLNSKLRDLLIKVSSGSVVTDEQLKFLIDEGFVYEDKDSIKLTEKGNEKINQLTNKMNVLEFYNMHPYIRPAVTVDGIIFYRDKLILIKRGYEPFKGMYALPGGFVNYNERVEDAFLREMKEEINVEVYNWKLFTVLSDPMRDPRGHTISIVFEGAAFDEPKAGDDAATVTLADPMEVLDMKLAFDHQEVVRKFIQCRSLPR